MAMVLFEPDSPGCHNSLSRNGLPEDGSLLSLFAENYELTLATGRSSQCSEMMQRCRNLDFRYSTRHCVWLGDRRASDHSALSSVPEGKVERGHQLDWPRDFGILESSTRQNPPQR